MKINRRSMLQKSAAACGLAMAISDTSGAGPSPDELTSKSASQIAGLIRAKLVSCEEVMKAHLARIEEINGLINAIVYQERKESLLKQAAAADNEIRRGQPLGPLHGVPFTVKDCIEAAGMPATCGMPELVGYRSRKDAEVVRRLKSAGGILLGKTNVPEFCMFGDTNNKTYGRTKNPHDLARETGGSSGGEAAIIAACGSPFGLGTDIAGSIREPAHYCGIAGLKPTNGRVPEAGVLNPFPPANWHWNTIGPMARRVEDLRLVLDVILGSTSREPSRSEGEKRDALRVAYFTSNGSSEAKPNPVGETVTKAADFLRKQGMDVTYDRPACFSDVQDVWWFNLNPDLGTTFRQWKKEYSAWTGQGVSDNYTEIAKLFLKWQDVLIRQGRYSAEARFRSGKRLHAFMADMKEFFQNYDVIVCPVWTNVAEKWSNSVDHFPDLEVLYDEMIKGGDNCTAAFNLTGWPAASVPVGTTDNGLPIGVQVVAGPLRDELVLDVAELLEEGFGGWKLPKDI